MPSTHKITRVFLALALAGGLTVASGAWAPTAGIAWAEDCDDDGQEDSAEGGKFVIEERNGQKVYVIKEAITVCGKVPRPSVVYVLQARTINYQWESLKQDFLPKILNSVKKAPF